MLDKERLRKSVQKAIQQMPCTAGIKRQELNEYKEPIGEPVLITTLT
jgi:hypothetical protein